MSLFVVGELLGCGSFGVVYEGSHIFSDRIKVKNFYCPLSRFKNIVDVHVWHFGVFGKCYCVFAIHRLP